MRPKNCELCDGDAALYCPSDSAFLCWTCDSKVHAANFLVARHLRLPVCSLCGNFTGDRLSGVGFAHSSSICPACSPHGDDAGSISSSSSSASSACISCSESVADPPKKICSTRHKRTRVFYSSNISDGSSKSAGKFSSEIVLENGSKDRRVTRFSRRGPTKVDSATEAVLRKWCAELGLAGKGWIQRAGRALRLCSNMLTVLPFRVCIATSLWICLRLCGDRSYSTWQVLRKIEQISCVPARLLLEVESRLLRALKSRRESFTRRAPALAADEGWAESSVNSDVEVEDEF